MQFKILVTGGAGAIGSNLCNVLAREHEVVALDNLSSGYRWLLDEPVQLVEGDIDGVDAVGVEDYPIGTDFTHIFHLAAFFANQNSVDHPYEDLRVNLKGTLSVLELARRCKNLQALVFASAGCSIYDRKNPLPLKEEYPVTLVHDTPYQISKMTGEMYCYFYQQHYGVPAVVFRFFNSFGPGEVPGRYRNVIPNFVWWAMHGQPLPVLGTGRETRDYIFVEDLVAGLMAGAFTAGVAGEAFNLGTGRETAVMDLAERVNTLVGNAAGITRGPRRDWDRCEKKAGDFSKARRLLGWEPRVAFDDGLERTVAWFRRHREQIAAAHDGLPAEQRLVLEVARLEHSRCTG